ncbi:MAG TPA: RagB/SusD family nutrient uptake outer membrane protein [Pedobacter sp.]|uniref:RagB/SusD family nutrient uptake outer membrane protein n=1 Tax=Pedobacter sp. TaxID=1411316 RepID=UPI002CE19BAE|nr:RagB/SusD family nutrient uptake outer membrane protein [Pedobacter sp.]HMI02379.1 RagB/SusD family nutrient uptake outer membrane protein [Pedobacter sp.]
MKKILSYRFIFALILSFFFTGCKKEWFDVKSDSLLVVPSSLKDFQALLDNDLFNSQGVALGEIASDGHFMTDAVFQRRGSIEKNAYTWSHDVPYISVSDWLSDNGNGFGAYKVIYNSNLILGGLIKLQKDGAEYNNVKGQALFHRGRCFYELSQVWAPPYLETTANSSLGIPLRLESDINIPSTRSTLRQTYDQIISDLTLAAALLPVTSLYKTRASKPAAFALLARTYLSMQDYKRAGLYADSCLKLYNTLIDFNTRSTTSSNPFEIFNPEVIFHESMANYSGLTSRASLLIDPMLYALYDNNDLRLNIFFIKNNTTGNITFKGNYTGSILQFSGISTNELLLIRAECFARNGKVVEAVQDLNGLLKTRWKKVNGITTYVDQVATDSEDALRIILKERKKELIIRGQRWTDLRRLNGDNRFKETITRIINGKTYVLEPGSYKYTFPIPDDVIQLSGMKQNIGW